MTSTDRPAPRDRRRLSRTLILGTTAATAVALGAASWSSGRPALGAGLAATAVAAGSFVAFGRSELAVAQSVEADERQASLNGEAAQLSYMAISTVALVGSVVELAQGRPGPFLAITMLGGVVHVVALRVLARRR